MQENWTRIAGVADVSEGDMIPLMVGELSLALYHVDGAWFCTDNVCTHAYAMLTDGWLEDYMVECPLHNGQFDIRTGKALCAPVTEAIRTFAVRVEGDDVLLALP